MSAEGAFFLFLAFSYALAIVCGICYIIWSLTRTESEAIRTGARAFANIDMPFFDGELEAPPRLGEIEAPRDRADCIKQWYVEGEIDELGLESGLEQAIEVEEG